jgi:probable HAF family extracellular repeat protein
LHGLGEDGEAAMLVACDETPEVRAILWSPEASVELPSLGGPSVTPYGVLGGGAALGCAESSDPYGADTFVSRPVFWEGGVVHDLGTLGGPLGCALASNARGLVVGACQPDRIDPSLDRRPMRACAWSTAGVRDLGDLGGGEAVAYDVNSRGWVAGSSTTAASAEAPGEEHAFVSTGKTLHDLGTLGGAFSLAWALNERGEVVGMSYTGEPSRPGVVSFHAFAWRRGTLRDLGTLGGSMSEAFDVNGDGVIVGWSSLEAPVDGTIDHAAVWQGDGPAIDLNALVADSRGCVLTRALSINDAGTVLADAHCYDGDQVVILEPIESRNR